MIYLSELKKASEKSHIRDDQMAEMAKKEYEKALAHLNKFQQTNEFEELSLAAGFLFESIKYKRKQVEPYIWLSYIFHVNDNEEMAVKYIRLAEVFDPSHPKVRELKKMILGEDSLTPEPEKPVRKHYTPVGDLPRAQKFKIFFNETLRLK